jgi:hypothetical protein
MHVQHIPVPSHAHMMTVLCATVPCTCSMTFSESLVLEATYKYLPIQITILSQENLLHMTPSFFFRTPCEMCHMTPCNFLSFRICNVLVLTTSHTTRNDPDAPVWTPLHVGENGCLCTWGREWVLVHVGERMGACARGKEWERVHVGEEGAHLYMGEEEHVCTRAAVQFRV